MKRLSAILLSIIIMCATLGSVLVFAAPKDGDSNKIIVGALDKASPYSSKNQSDDKQILTYCINQCFGGEYDVEYKYYSSYSDMLTALGKGKINLAFPVAGYDNAASEYGIEMSNVLITSNVALVYSGSYTDRTIDSIAVDTNSITYYYVQAVFPESTKVFCGSQDDCLEAVKDGRASCMMVNNINSSDIAAELQKNNKLEYIEVPFSMNVCFAVKQGKTELLGKVNTGINNISKTELNNKIYNIENNTTSNVVSELKGYSIYFKIIIGVFVLLIIFGFIYISNLKARRDVAKDRLLKQNQLLREAKIKQEQFTELSRKRREELERLEREISEKIANQQEEADKLKEQSENLQQKNEEMKSQTDLLETMLLDKYVQVEDYHKQLEEYEERLERYLMVENYQKSMEQDVRDRIDMLGYSKMHLEEVDLKMSLRDIIPDIKALAETANVDFSLEIDEMKTPVVACDLKKLNEMVIGLVFTAMRSTEEYGKVELGIHQIGDDGAFAFFDYTCVFTGDTIDYSGNAITNLGGVLKIQRNEEGKTLMEVSVRFPLIDVLVDAVGEDILNNDEEQAYIDDDDIMDDNIENSEAEVLME